MGKIIGPQATGMVLLLPGGGVIDAGLFGPGSVVTFVFADTKDCWVHSTAIVLLKSCSNVLITGCQALRFVLEVPTQLTIEVYGWAGDIRLTHIAILAIGYESLGMYVQHIVGRWEEVDDCTCGL